MYCISLYTKAAMLEIINVDLFSLLVPIQSTLVKEYLYFVFGIESDMSQNLKIITKCTVILI